MSMHPALACMVEIKVDSVLFGQGSCERSNHLLHFLKTLYDLKMRFCKQYLIYHNLMKKQLC